MNLLNLSDFDKSSKHEWLEKIKLDLKGKSLDDCYTQLDENLVLDPFASLEDISALKLDPIQRFLPSPLSYLKLETGRHTDEELNEYLLNHLSIGLGAVGIVLKDSSDLNTILNGVHTDMIFLDLEASSQHQIDQFLNGLNTAKKYQVSVRLRDGLLNEELVPSGIRTHRIKEQQNESVIQSLTNMAEELISVLEDINDPSRILLEMHVDDRTLRGIIKLRAMRLVWNNLLSNFDVEIKPALILASAADHLASINLEDGLIACANISTGMLLGGADLIESFPFTNDDERNRFALNIHHLHKYEAKMTDIIDPLNGSFAIEKATIELARAVWEKI